MEIPTLQEVLDANSLEHKFQAQIKAALDATDNGNGSTQTEHYTKPLVQKSIYTR